MLDVLETLFKLLPFIVGILWFLRRQQRIKGQSNSPALPPKDQEVELEDAFIGTSSFEPNEVQSEDDGEDAYIGRPSFEPEEQEDDREEFFAPLPSPEASSLPLNQELQSLDPSSSSSPEATQDIFERIEKLPPLARAILWSTILEPVAALKEPEENSF